MHARVFDGGFGDTGAGEYPSGVASHPHLGAGLSRGYPPDRGLGDRHPRPTVDGDFVKPPCHHCDTESPARDDRIRHLGL